MSATRPKLREFEEQEMRRIEDAKMAIAAGQEETPKTKKAAKAKKKGKKRKVERPFEIQYYRIGDTVDVHYNIVEGEKERIQVFTGTIIRMKGSGLTETFTVRRIVAGEGVERIFPVYSPRLMKVVVTRRGNVRRSKLYYLRDRVGKATKTRELLGEGVQRLRKYEEAHAKELESRYAEVLERIKEQKGESAEE